MGAYFTFYFSGAFLGPIMSGNIAAKHGWRSFFWLSVALSAFVTLLLVFLFPETKWQRNSVNHAGGKAGQSETQSQEEKAIDSEASSEEAAGGKQVGKGKPSKLQYSPVQKPDGAWWKYIVRDITTPIIVFFNPIVFWVSSRYSLLLLSRA
jgi:MFS family permease